MNYLLVFIVNGLTMQNPNCKFYEHVVNTDSVDVAKGVAKDIEQRKGWRCCTVVKDL